MLSEFKIRNDDEYEQYFQNNDERNKLHVALVISSDFFPSRNFRDDIEALHIYIKPDVGDLVQTLQLPQSLLHLSIECHTGTCNVALPDLSMLNRLIYLGMMNLNFYSFTELPRNLTNLYFFRCIFPDHVNRQMLQPGFLPNRLNKLTMLYCEGLIAMPLLPLSLKNVDVSSRRNGIKLTDVYNKSLMVDGSPQMVRNRINQLNEITELIKLETGFGEVENLLMASSIRGNNPATYAIETEENEMKEYLRNVGGKRATKKQRRRKRKTRNYKFRK